MKPKTKATRNRGLPRLHNAAKAANSWPNRRDLAKSRGSAATVLEMSRGTSRAQWFGFLSLKSNCLALGLGSQHKVAYKQFPSRICIGPISILPSGTNNW